MFGKVRGLLLGVTVAGLCIYASLSPSLAQSDGDPETTRKTGKIYFAAIYRPGPQWVKGKTVTEQPGYEEHGAFIHEMKSKGALLLGGPFEDGSGDFGIFDFADIGSAREAITRDPIVRDEILQVEIHPWQPLIPGAVHMRD